MPHILHFSIPDFPIAVARVVDHGLRGRPVAVAPASSGRALLQAVSTEARVAGLWPGMPLEQGLRRCPELKLVLPDRPLLRRAAFALDELCAGFAPLREPAGGGRLFLDASGCERLLGPGRDIAMRLEREARDRLRLQGSVGVAGNKLVSKIAAGYLRRPGVCDVLAGSEADFLAPLPADRLPGIGRQRQRQLLEELCLRQIGDIARLELPRLALLFGSFAPLLQQRARGIDHTPVQPPRRLPEVAAESLLPQASNSRQLLRAELCRLAEECGLQLRRRNRVSHRLELRLDYCDGVSHHGRRKLATGVNADEELLAELDRLLEQTLVRRVQLRGLQLRCRDLAPPGQLDLFAAPHRPNARKLQEALDRVRERFGERAVLRGRGMVGNKRE